jgi:N-acetylmuramoyl-L-alanine amidase
LYSLVAGALTITLALVALSRTAGTAATVEQYRLRRIGHPLGCHPERVSRRPPRSRAGALSSAEGVGSTLNDFCGNTIEISFPVRGRALQWHLSGNGQELRLDLEDARLAGPAEQSFGHGLFPLVGLSLHDLGRRHPRVVIRVSGKVDYVAAQLGNELVVRIAPAGHNTNLADPLVAEIERPRQRSFTPASIVAGNPASRMLVHPSANDQRHAEVGDATHATAAELAAAIGGPELSAANVDAAGKSAAMIAGFSAPASSPVLNVRPVAISPSMPSAGARPVVVIDAGHGGLDPGTESAAGLAEKTIALAIARGLAAALETRGVDAELTRTDDNFLSLAQRTELANHAHADLFISLHLNSSPDKNTTGIETYYLNNTNDRATIRLARIENAAGYGTPGEYNLNYVLTDLRQEYKANESASLARMIEAESTAAIDAAMGIRVNALGAKTGPFYVLVGAEMPSVLVECGFLSNPREAALVTQPRYQQALADGIATAIIHYFHADATVGNL